PLVSRWNSTLPGRDDHQLVLQWCSETSEYRTDCSSSWCATFPGLDADVMRLTARCLQPGKGITGYRPHLVLIPLTDYVAAQAGVAQGQVDALEPAVLHPVIHPQIPFPLAVGTAYGGIHIIPTQVGGGGLEARYPGIGEVIGVAGQPGFFTGALELADLRVGDQVGGSTVAIVDE